MLQLDPVEGEEEGESLFVSDQRLCRIKAALHVKQVETEFVDGCLVCNKRVQVRYNASGALEIEGPISLDYYLIRKTVDEIHKLR